MIRLPIFEGLTPELGNSRPTAVFRNHPDYAALFKIMRAIRRLVSMTEDLDIYGTAKELIKQRGLKRVSSCGWSDCNAGGLQYG